MPSRDGDRAGERKKNEFVRVFRSDVLYFNCFVGIMRKYIMQTDAREIVDLFAKITTGIIKHACVCVYICRGSGYNCVAIHCVNSSRAKDKGTLKVYFDVARDITHYARYLHFNLLLFFSLSFFPI